MPKTSDKNKSRLSFLAEYILDFASSINLVRKMEKEAPNYKQIAFYIIGNYYSRRLIHFIANA